MKQKINVEKEEKKSFDIALKKGIKIFSAKRWMWAFKERGKKNCAFDTNKKD